MQNDGLSEHIFPYASHLDCMRGEKLASVDEAASWKRDRVIPFVHDQHPDKPFVSVNDEVASELMLVFLLKDKFLLC